jgi:hypothetical protein
MLIGIVVILIMMWTMFPTMLIGNIVVTAGVLVWGVWAVRQLT